MRQGMRDKNKQSEQRQGPPSEGPPEYMCAYLNGTIDAAPLLLAVDGIKDVAGLLDTATVAWRKDNFIDRPITVAYHPDGAVVPKSTLTSELSSNSVLVFSCGEPFQSASVPERAKNMYASQLRRRQMLGGLVRTQPSARRSSLSPSRAQTQRYISPGVGSPRPGSPRPGSPRPGSPRNGRGRSSGSLSARSSGEREGARSASPRLHNEPWMFSPSGRWESPLALRHDAR